jgi:hypothetical protein
MKYFLLLAQINDANIPVISGGQLIANGLNIAYFVIGMIAVVMMIMAGYSYMTADGDPGKAQKGMRTIIYCAIGLVVVIFAFAITNFVAGRAAQ